MSKIEVNAVEPQSGTTLTLGASGDTVALAAGATSSGFGATYNGTVNWNSTIRTSGFTAVSGVGYFCDTSSAAFTVTLPANPSIGDIVAIKDWSSTAATNNITIGRNGQKIEGNTTDGLINVHGDAQTLVFSGTSRGWMVVGSGLLEGIQGPQYVAATGGTVLTCGNYKVHVFTGPGSFVVSCGGNDIGSNSVEYLIVAGGGGSGAGEQGGGGGAGGFRQNYPSPTIAGLPVTATTYPITVGSGGAGGGPSTGNGANGNPSIFSTITSAGGGAGGNGVPAAPATPTTAGSTGGSGGGGGTGCASGGAGNTPPVSPPQGNPGGNAGPSADSGSRGGGGGGAGAAGANSQPGIGGIGSSWTNPLFGPTAPSYGTAGPVPGVRYFAGGGGGGAWTCSPTPGGAGGGGKGAGGGPGTANSGTVNTGGGGGGSFAAGCIGASGGSGIVVIRYKYQ
jgi:hypothetical protein